MTRVFVSHATRDNPVAQEVCAYLHEHDIRCWLDNFEIDPPSDWLKQVAAAVRESSHGLFLLSNTSIKSPAAMREYRDLLKQEKPVYVALIESVPARDLPYDLRTAHTYDLVTDLQAGLVALVSDMQANAGMVRMAGSEEDRRDITITLQANLTDLDTDKFIELIGRLVDVGITDIKVIDVTAG
jgi:hypothetical protein